MAIVPAADGAAADGAAADGAPALGGCAAGVLVALEQAVTSKSALTNTATIAGPCFTAGTARPRR